MRKFLVAGNWKMNNNVTESVNYAKKLSEIITPNENVEVLICPTFTSLYSVNEVLNGSKLLLGAQNVFFEDKGAYTGEVSADMLESCGVKYVIVGHSERRQYFGETDEEINKRVNVCLKKGFRPIICLGESKYEREKRKEEKIVAHQVKRGLAGLTEDQLLKVVVAYEPVWAIGTGETATPEIAQKMHKLIRTVIAEISSKSVADKIQILYGGSLKASNAEEILKQPDIDGGLIGGASLKAEDFTSIINAASKIEK